MAFQILGDDFVAALIVDLSLVLRVTTNWSSLTTATSRNESWRGQIIPIAIVDVATAAQLNADNKMMIR